MGGPSVNVDIDLSQILDFIDEWNKIGVLKVLQRASLALQAELVKEAPVDTGRLRGSIQAPQQKTENQFLLPINAKYWTAIQFGTGIHGPEGKPFDIYPKKGKVLRFEVKGETVFAKFVKDHPGQKPNPFFDRAFDNIEPKIGDIIQDVIEELL